MGHLLRSTEDQHDHREHVDVRRPGHDHSYSHDRPDHDRQERGRGVLGRTRHAISELFGGHSHDSADQIDDGMEANAAGRRALWVSLVALMATAVLQGLVVAVSGSVALLGDTVHNVADAMTAVPLLVAFALARRAATKRFTYGYGRAEDLAGLFVVAMITLSALVAGYEAITRLIHPHGVSHVWFVALAGLVGFAGNELVARYRIRVGRQIGSAALVADGLHARTDGLTSLAVVVGAGGVALGWSWADPVIGLLISIGIAGVLRSAVKEVGARLMDAVDPELVERAEASLATVDGINALHDLRMRWIGHTLHGEATLEVDPALSMAEAQAIADHAKEHLLVDVPRLKDPAIHLVSGAPAG